MAASINHSKRFGLNILCRMVNHMQQEDSEKITKAQLKKQAFDKEFRSLVKQSQETILARYCLSINLGNDRAELTCLNRYLNIYNNMDPQEHYQYFEIVYNSKRLEILNCLKDDRWIRTGNITIQFGRGNKPDIEEKCKQVKIMLSDIFLIACDLRSTAEQGLDVIDETFAREIGSKDLIRPNILLLHLLRIFYHINDSSDKAQLGEIVTQLENELGVIKKTVNEDPQKSSAPNPGEGIVGIFNLATNVMGKMGYETPPDMKPPTEKQVLDVMNNVFNNKGTQDVMSKMVDSIKDCKDFGSIIQEVIKNVGDQKTMNVVRSSVSQVANPAEEIGQ